MSYWGSCYPFVDFAAFSFNDTNKQKEVIHFMKESKRLGSMRLIEFDSKNFANEVIICSNSSSSKLPVDGFLFSGTAVINGKYIMGNEDFSSSFDIDDINIGQFSLIKAGNKGFVAKTDLYGHGQLFIWKSKRFSIVSNRSHLLSLVLKEIGEKLSINKKVAKTLFIGNSNIFSQQISQDEMLTDGVSMIRPDVKVMMHRGNITFSDNKPFLDLFRGKRLRYNKYIHDGAEQIIDICRTILDDNRFTKILVDLSGGKDSRMVFAGVNKIKNWQEKCQISAQNVPNSQDLAIACGLTKIVNGTFDDGLPVPTHPLTIAENLKIWRSYFYGAYHRMGAFGWSHRGNNLSSINLSGGNGEAARGFWSQIFERQLSEFNLAGVPIEDVAAKIVRASTVHGSPENDDVIDCFSRTLKSLPRNNILDKLDLHYIYYRNRAHFGMREFSTYSSQQTFFPLLAPSLIKAAWSLSPTERIGKKVIADILNAINPMWTSFKFDKGEVLDGPHSHFAIDVSSSTSEWEEAKRQADLNKKSAQGNALMKWSEWPIHLKDEALSVANTAIESGVVSEEVVLSSLKKTDTRLGREFASKLFAVHDAVNP